MLAIRAFCLELSKFKAKQHFQNIRFFIHPQGFLFHFIDMCYDKYHLCQNSDIIFNMLFRLVITQYS